MDDRHTSALARWSPLAGLLFVAGIVSILANPAVDTGGDDPATIVAHATEHAGWIEWNMVVAILSVPLLAAFVAGLLAATRSEAGAGTALTAVAGTIATVLFLLAFLLWSAPLIELPSEPAASQEAQAAVYLALEDVGWVAFVGFGAAAGTMVLGASYAAWKAGVLSAPWAGVSAALGLLGGVLTAGFVGLFALLAWFVLAAGFLLVRGRRPGAARVRPAAAAR